MNPDSLIELQLKSLPFFVSSSLSKPDAPDGVVDKTESAGADAAVADDSQATRRRERDRALREADLLNAAETLFGEKGYFQTSMEDIARAAGYATGTIYLYFKSKKRLYQTLLERKCRDHLDRLHSAAAPHGNPGDRLRALLKELFRFFRHDRSFFRIYIAEFLSPDSQLSAGLAQSGNRLRQQFSELFLGVYREGIADGTFYPTEPEIMEAAVAGLIEFTLREACTRDPQDGAAPVTDYTLELCERAFFQRTGR